MADARRTHGAQRPSTVRAPGGALPRERRSVGNAAVGNASHARVMRNLKLLPVLASVLLLAACESPFETVTERARTEGFTALLEAVERTAEALSASKGQDGATIDDIVTAVAEFPGNGLEVTPSASNVVVTASTGMYAGCSATFVPTYEGYGVRIDDIVCDEPAADAPASGQAN